MIGLCRIHLRLTPLTKSGNSFFTARYVTVKSPNQTPSTSAITISYHS
jgi:hypothetical protein